MASNVIPGNKIEARNQQNGTGDEDLISGIIHIHPPGVLWVQKSAEF
jgi:hypothetical protein